MRKQIDTDTVHNFIRSIGC